MNAHSCHAGAGHGRSTSSGRIRTATGWGVPSLILLLLPKCPLCVAAYVAMITGAGISLTTAAWVRTAAIAVCLCALGWLLVRAISKRLCASSSQ